MDSKRKSNGGGLPAGEELEDRASKRRKLPTDTAELLQGETAVTTTQQGLRLLELVKKTEDKSGRPVATAFLKLPSKRDLPDYYQITQIPIALDTIEAKLKRHEFPTLTTLESYFKRMVQNAKDYNEKGSQIVEDSERIRKAVSNFMVKHNPAYKKLGYTPFPTPLPADVEDDTKVGGSITSATKKRGRPFKNPQDPRSSATPGRSRSQSHIGGGDYDGLTFQHAQEKVIEELMAEAEFPGDELPFFTPFLVMPPKSLKDYYKLIPHPTSLNSLQKRVKGTTGKKDGPKVSEYKSWAAFEDAASALWDNAWLYNEPGSDIYNLATTLKEHFYRHFNRAKKAVTEPVGPKIKLKLPEQPKITLKFPAGKASPADTPAPPTNGQNGSTPSANGTSRRNPFSASRTSATPVPSLEQNGRPGSAAGSVVSSTPSNPLLVKNEHPVLNSPALPAVNGTRSGSQAVSIPGVNGTTTMAPPSTPGPSTLNTYSTGGYAQSFPHQNSQAQTHNFESRLRQPGQDASNAMITNLSLATHLGLNISCHFHMDLPPSPTLTQQSFTITLPSTHYYLQIKPTIASWLSERQYRLFVTSGNRLNALPTIPGHPVDQRHPLFEARLHPGVNRIEVELIAALPKGAQPVNGQEFEIEKVVVYINLSKS